MPPDTIANSAAQASLIDPASPMLSTARMFLSSLFGGIPTWAVDLIGGETGLRSGAATSMLALGAHSVLNFIGGRVRGEGMTASALSGFLNSEAPAVLKQLPASFRERIQGALHRHSSSRGRARVALFAAGDRIRRGWRRRRFWRAPCGSDSGTPTRPQRRRWWGCPQSARQNDRRARPGTVRSAHAPERASIVVPERGVETRLLAFITSSQSPDKTSWFDFDRLLFDTGAATLQPQSDDQLRAVAAILKAYPNAQAKIGATRTTSYSGRQPQAVGRTRSQREIAVDRHGRRTIPARGGGYGEAHPVADNATEAGRAMNRRISLLVTQK